MKYICIWLFLLFFCNNIAMAIDFEIIPAASWTTNETVLQDIKNVHTSTSSTPSKKHFWDVYNKGAKSMDNDIGWQIKSGVMSRNTILNYAAYIIRFVSGLGMVVGAAMVIYAGYRYVMAAFGGKEPSSSIIANVVQWLLVIIFSYAIMRVLIMAFIQ